MGVEERLLERYGTFCNAILSNLDATTTTIDAQVNVQPQVISGYIEDVLLSLAERIKGFFWRNIVESPFRIPAVLDPLILRLKDLAESKSAKAVTRALKFIRETFQSIWDYLLSIFGSESVKRTQEESESFFAMTVPGFVGDIVLSLIKTFANGLGSILGELRNIIYTAIGKVCDAAFAAAEATIHLSKVSVRFLMFALSYTDYALEILSDGGKKMIAKLMDVFSRRLGVMTKKLWTDLKTSKSTLSFLPESWATTIVFEGIANAGQWVVDNLLWLTNAIVMLPSCAGCVFGSLFSIMPVLRSEAFKEFFDHLEKEKSQQQGATMGEMCYSLEQARFLSKDAEEIERIDAALRMVSEYAEHSSALKGKRAVQFSEGKDKDILSICDDIADVLTSIYTKEDIDMTRFGRILEYRTYGDFDEYEYAKRVELFVAAVAHASVAKIALDNVNDTVLIENPSKKSLYALEDEKMSELQKKYDSEWNALVVLPLVRSGLDKLPFEARMETMFQTFRNLPRAQLFKVKELAEARYENTRIMTERLILAVNNSQLNKSFEFYTNQLHQYFKALEAADVSGELADASSEKEKREVIMSFLDPNARESFETITISTHELMVLARCRTLKFEEDIINVIDEIINDKDKYYQWGKAAMWALGTGATIYICITHYKWFLETYNPNPTGAIIDQMVEAPSFAATIGSYWSFGGKVVGGIMGFASTMVKATSPPEFFDGFDPRNMWAYAKDLMQSGTVEMVSFLQKYVYLLTILKYSIPAIQLVFVTVHFIIVASLFVFYDIVVGMATLGRGWGYSSYKYPLTSMLMAIARSAGFGVINFASLIGMVALNLATARLNALASISASAFSLMTGGLGLAKLPGTFIKNSQKSLNTLSATNVKDFILAQSIWDKIQQVDLLGQTRALKPRDFVATLNVTLAEKYPETEIIKYARQLELETKQVDANALGKLEQAKTIVWKKN